MCQLSLFNTHDANLNKILALQIPRHNSQYTNKDGFGLFSKSNGVWKTTFAASVLLNAGMIIKENIKGTSPVIAHVRAASRGIAVTRENVHPFETEDFVLAHNGTLFKRNENVTAWEAKEDSRPSDSLVFLEALQESFKKKKNVVDALKDAMEDFKGKFAFLIFCKKDGKYYAVRGRTADLHISYLSTGEGENKKSLGYVINTQKDSLEKALIEVSNIFQLGTGLSINYEIKELDKETIYLCDEEDVSIIGKLEEVSAYLSPNFQKAATAATTSVLDRVRNFGKDGPSQMEVVDSDGKTEQTAFGRQVKEIEKIASDNCMTLGDLDRIINVVLGISLYQINEEDVHNLSNIIFPQLTPKAKVRKYMNQQNINFIPLDFYSKYKIQYPIGANKETDAGIIIKHLKILTKEV